MKYDVFFDLAKERGIEEAELSISTSYSFSASVFRGELNNYSVGNDMTIVARGIINGKFGSAICDSFSKEKASFLVDEIVKNAKIIENEDPSIIFKGSEHYKKVNTFNKELENVSPEDKINKLYELEKKVKELDQRVISVEAEFSEESSSYTLLNSHGLKLSQKNNYFVYVVSALVSDSKVQKNGFEIFLDNDFNNFNVDELAKKAVDKAVAQLGGEAPKSKKYRAVLSQDVVATLTRVLVSHANSEQVQKNSSFFINKLDQQVVSRKLTISEKPLLKNVFARWFDDEGVRTYNKDIIKGGVLKTYLYNLTTAAKENRESTGNGYKAGSKVVVSTVNLCLKPGKKSLDDLFMEVKNGVYITSVTGLHAGMNAQSGNFSLQAQGFMVENGVKTHALDLITVSGNLFTVLNEVLSVGSDVKLSPSGISTPSISVKSLMVGGK
ncbi:MAG: TldD/PmbA family protein [Gammaproteobacteria bacterium]|nr:TldD/PmbA family protein [Gammaproteobacteria bacterium]